MTPRITRLREASVNAKPTVSAERASLLTDFYLANDGKHSIPVMRALSFQYLCEHKTIFLGEDELIVGERGPFPKAVPTYPELTCHSLDDLRILNSRPKTSYAVSDECLRVYEQKVIPYWRGRSLRDKLFQAVSEEWRAAYDAGIFTEFMEQRAPGHTVLDDKIYRKGLLEFQKDIATAIAGLDFEHDSEAFAKREQLRAMHIACDAVMLFARRHAALARERGLEKIAAVCEHVPAYAPRDFQEALQAYWFCHQAVITELNGWDAFSPGHLDQHLGPFYRQGLADGSLTHESARELLAAFLIKFNNHPAPPKVGVTAAESGTYTDFAAINIGGLLADGADGSNEVSHMLLELVEELHLVQPNPNLQLSRQTPDPLLHRALRVIRHGYGYPSIFNIDGIVEEQLRQGKTIEDARAGGTSGCVETGAFGKEAYILTGYFNLPKILELTLHNGVDPRTGTQLGPRTGAVESFATFDELFAAYRKQLSHFIEIKMQGNHLIEQMYAMQMPAPFLSVLTDDCIRKGKDYNAGGARYNNSYIQFVGIGTVTDSFAALRQAVFTDRLVVLKELVKLLADDFKGDEKTRQRLLHRMPKYGNDNPQADDLMVRAFNACFELLDGRPNAKGGHYRVEMLPTTCHVYFGSVLGATPDGRRAGTPVSEGISPVQGADRLGPTAVLKSAGKMDHIKTGGTLLNMKFTPSLLAEDPDIEKVGHLVRGYFRMHGHHIQFNVVDAPALREAQADPQNHRDLIVRVAGYSDYFCDLSQALQDEIIARTEHGTLPSQ